MTSKTMFQAIYGTLFGTEASNNSNGAVAMHENFEIFHKYFNFLWLGLPVGLFPEACRARKRLLQQPCSADLLSREDIALYIKFAAEHMQANGYTEADIAAHNLVYLHVNINTFKVTYWLVYFLISHSTALEALVEEINDAVEKKAEDSDGEIVFKMEEVDALPVLGNYYFKKNDNN